VIWIKNLLLIGVLAVCATSVSAQEKIYLKNPSFEGSPHSGGENQFLRLNHLLEVNPFSPIPDWTDCGFKLETPPDLHGFNTGFFNVYRTPYDGVSFLGMVVRFNETWERVSQKLEKPLQAGKCYSFSIHLARDLNYKSATRESEEVEQSFAKPCVLRIFGGNGYCSTKEMLGETVEIENTEWMRYDFVFKPKKNWDYFEVQAYWKTPVFFPYNGNLLLDGASVIEEVSCPEEGMVAAVPHVPEKIVEDVAINIDPRSGGNNDSRSNTKERPPTKTQKTEPKSDKSPPVVVDQPKEKILKDLTIEKVSKGQVIQIEKLYFGADKTEPTTTSYGVLDEVYDFLVDNPKVIVEIGGHTNSKPPHSYCDKLSLKRAESVSDYLINKGIDENRLKAKGYGKREPIDRGKNYIAHKKNQRVEIKILSLDGAEG